MIAHNTAEHGAGLAIPEGGAWTLVNCVIANNTARGLGGGVQSDGRRNAFITNSILWGNSPNEVQAPGGAVLMWYSDVEGGFSGVGNIDEDPLFDFEGGYCITRGSPCIDTGTNSPEGGLPDWDLVGNPRVVDGDGDFSAVVDMGIHEFTPDSPWISVSRTAVEFHVEAGGVDPDPEAVQVRNSGGGTLNWAAIEDCPWLSVSPSTGDSEGEIDDLYLTADTSSLEHGTYEAVVSLADSDTPGQAVAIEVRLHVHAILGVPDQYATIQEAIDVSVPGDVIVVQDGVYTGPGNRDLDFRGKALSVRSENGAEGCVIDCEGLGRAFHFHSGETPASRLEGFTIRNGLSVGVRPSDGTGAGIRCFASSPTIVGCVITQNTAVGEFARGGAFTAPQEARLGLHADWQSCGG